MPDVQVLCSVPGDQPPYEVMWNTVTATGASGQLINCAEGTNAVTVNGGSLAAGNYTVTCRVSNNAGCTAMESFTFSVDGKIC